jgi:hypothetical protein
MSQIVKIQINSDIGDVADITAGTMDQVMSNLEQLRKLVLMVKKTLSDTDVFNESDRQKLKHSLPLLDDAKMLLNKIDMRLGDVASISSGLVSVFEKPLEKVDSEPEQAVKVQQEEETDDNITAR